MVDMTQPLRLSRTASRAAETAAMEGTDIVRAPAASDIPIGSAAVVTSNEVIEVYIGNMPLNAFTPGPPLINTMDPFPGSYHYDAWARANGTLPPIRPTPIPVPITCLECNRLALIWFPFSVDDRIRLRLDVPAYMCCNIADITKKSQSCGLVQSAGSGFVTSVCVGMRRA